MAAPVINGSQHSCRHPHLLLINATCTIKDTTTFLINRWNQSSPADAALHKEQKYGGATLHRQSVATWYDDDRIPDGDVFYMTVK